MFCPAFYRTKNPRMPWHPGEGFYGSDQVGGLLVLVDHGVLTLDLVEDGDLGLDVLGLHKQLCAVDQGVIPSMVEAVGAHAEGVPHVGLQSDLLLVPDQLVVAVSGGAVLVVDGLVIQNRSGNFLVQVVLVYDGWKKCKKNPPIPWNWG